MNKRSGFTIMEVIFASAILISALVYFSYFMTQSAQNRKYVASFSELNTIESNLRIAMQDRALCGAMLAFDPDSPHNQNKIIVNNPMRYTGVPDVNSWIPNSQFDHDVDSGEVLVNYNSLKAGDTYLVKQDEVLPSGLSIYQLRLKLASSGMLFTSPSGEPRFLYYASLIIKGKFRVNNNSSSNELNSSTAFIPLMLIVDEQGKIRECTTGKTSATEGCRLVSTLMNTTLKSVIATCNPDEVLISGGATCNRDSSGNKVPLWANFPGIANWWLYGCANNPAGGGTVYGYCCRY